MDSGILEGVSIRHLITHTHGLRLVNGEIEKEFPAGEVGLIEILV